MRAYALLLSCLTGVLMAPEAVLASKTYGLVIGVDEYQYISDLHGAENDARDIANALSGLGADVTMLLNSDATREAVLSTWRDLATRLKPEDQLIVSYAGHGSHEPEHHKGSEADGRDETLLLSGFSPYGPAAAERIRDDEIGELLALTKGQVIFVADACHSGTVARTLTPTLGYRYVAVDGIIEDPLPPPPPPKAHEAEKADAALFIAAGNDSEKTPEFLIDGKPRGALSYAFANSLRGNAADENGDQILSKGEVETFVRKTVREVSRGVQRPQVSPAGGNDLELFALTLASDISPPLPPIFERDFDQLFDLAIHIPGLDFQNLEGARMMPVPGAAEFVFDLNARKVTSMVGDVVRDLPERPWNELRGEVQKTIDTLRLVTTLRVMPSDLDVRFADGDRLYDEGDTVTVQVEGRRQDNLILMNIAANGEMAFLYPLSEFGDPNSVAAWNRLNLDLRVQAPFGSDHILAIEAPDDNRALVAALSRFHGTRDVRGLWASLRSNATDHMNFAIFPFHTRAGREG